jgi:hypothetical protein
MKIATIEEPNTFNQMPHTLSSDFPLFILAFPNEYGLMVSNSLKDVEVLYQVKEQLPNMCKSSFRGRTESFINLKEPYLIPFYDYFNLRVDGTFFRLPLKEKPIVDGCAHFTGAPQLLVENSQIRVSETEDFQLSNKSTSDLFRSSYQASTISSLNLSGSAEGVITSRKEAGEYGLQNSVPLFIQTGYKENKAVSYPIFSVNHSGEFIIEREGLRMNQFLSIFVLDLIYV